MFRSRRFILSMLAAILLALGFSVTWAQTPKSLDDTLASGFALAEPASVHAELNVDSLQPGQQAVVAVVLEIAAGFHSQSNKPYDENLIKTEVTLADSPTVAAFAPIYPEGHDEILAALGKINVYTNQAIIYVPVQVSSTAAAGATSIEGTITYQICNDKACLQPVTAPFKIASRIVVGGQITKPNHPELFSAFDPSVFSNLVKATAPVQKVELFGRDLDQTPIVFTFFAAFVIGIIFNVVPCVLPVLPLKAIGFYEVSQHNRAKCLLLGVVFSLGLITVFAVLGLLVVVLKKFAWGELFSNPYFLGTIVLVLLVMAFNMFGTFDVGLPTWIYRVTPRHDTYTGNFLFGILTAVLSTPCTIGLFALLLIWATRQPPLLGLSLVTMVGAGMSFPYLVLSALPELARKFPRTGPWSELVKQMMGFLLLGSAIYFARGFIGRVISDHGFWYALFATALVAALFLVAKSSRISKSFAGIVVSTMIALAITSATGSVVWRITHPPIDWQPYSEAALQQARASGQPVMVEFTANWCTNCLQLEVSVFQDESVVKAIKERKVVTLRADLSKANAPGWILLRKVTTVGAIPLTAIYHGTTAPPEQLAGLYASADLLKAIK